MKYLIPRSVLKEKVIRNNENWIGGKRQQAVLSCLDCPWGSLSLDGIPTTAMSSTSLTSQMAPGYTERHTHLPQLWLSQFQEGFWLMEKDEKENQLCGRENWAIKKIYFLWKVLSPRFLPHFTWQQGSGQNKKGRYGDNAHTLYSIHYRVLLCLSLWTKPKPGRASKLFIWFTQENQWNNYTETTK